MTEGGPNTYQFLRSGNWGRPNYLFRNKIKSWGGWSFGFYALRHPSSSILIVPILLFCYSLPSNHKESSWDSNAVS